MTEFLICYAELIFSDDQPQPDSLEIQDSSLGFDSLDGSSDIVRRPKSLPLATPTKLLRYEYYDEIFIYGSKNYYYHFITVSKKQEISNSSDRANLENRSISRSAADRTVCPDITQFYNCLRAPSNVV